MRSQSTVPNSPPQRWQLLVGFPRGQRQSQPDTIPKERLAIQTRDHSCRRGEMSAISPTRCMSEDKFLSLGKKVFHGGSWSFCHCRCAVGGRIGMGLANRSTCRSGATVAVSKGNHLSSNTEHDESLSTNHRVEERGKELGWFWACRSYRRLMGLIEAKRRRVGRHHS